MIGSLEGVTEINGKKVITGYNRPIDPSTGAVDWKGFDEMREESPICIDHEKDMISFKMLTKPVSEGGNLKLCQLTELIATAKEILEYLNGKFPCRENARTIIKLDEALMWQKKRTDDRIKRNVEGKNQK